jgi:hypothetical protein
LESLSAEEQVLHDWLLALIRTSMSAPATAIDA